MERRVEATFLNKDSVEEEIMRLVNQENYEFDELLLLSDNQNDFSNNISNVEVRFLDASSAEDSNSFWERLKEVFTFDNQDNENNENALEKYGVATELSEHYMEVLQKGELILLVDQNAPRNDFKNNQNEEEASMSKDKKDIKRKEEEEIEKRPEEPELSGEETTVEKETSTEAPEEENKAEKNIQDPLNAKKHVERYQDPSSASEHADEDIKYTEEMEDAGIQSEEE